MARVTVEDCILKVPNRFELVLLSAQRAREIAAGADLTVDRDNDKNPVVALREIADETVELEKLEGGVIQGLQKHVEFDEPEEEEEMELIGMDAAALAVAAAQQGNEDALSVEDEAEAADAGDEATTGDAGEEEK